MANNKLKTLAAAAEGNKTKREVELSNPAPEITQAEKKVEAPVKEQKPAEAPAKKETRGRKPRPGEQDRPTNARGCRLGYERRGYVLPSALVEQIRNMSKYFGKTDSAMVEVLLAQGVKDAIAKHGEKVVKAQKEKEVF